MSGLSGDNNNANNTQLNAKALILGMYSINNN